ncbi:hypothetical protein DL771_008070 [Monosporascus sp. 5C6A]|nr:hypothetical protein DL771_008070 [Monosporascus sp. 5C6A]
MRVAVIGGGPAGLTTLKHLLEAHKYLGGDAIEAKLFESEEGIGGTFLKRMYEDAELVSSKYLTAFSDFRAREDDPDYLSSARYLEYLGEYTTAFNLWPFIHLSTPVTAVRRKGRSHVISYATQDGKEGSWICDAVAVCSGLHVTPNIPSIRGIDKVPKSFHSSLFKSREQFGSNTTVVVLGTGETAMDIAHLAVTAPTKRVVICHHEGFSVVAKRTPSPILFPSLASQPHSPNPPVPVDTYLHASHKWGDLPGNVFDCLVKTGMWLMTGTSAGYDQWVGGYPSPRWHTSKGEALLPLVALECLIIFTKSSKAMPYISKPYRKDTIFQRLRSSIIQVPIPETHGRQIDMAPWPSHVDSEGVLHFVDNGRPEYRRMRDAQVRPDVLVFATGYTQRFDFLDSTYPTISDLDVREVWRRDEPSVGFIGFVRPGFGAIPPLAELQAQLWVLNLLAPESLQPLLPQDEPHYRLGVPADARIKYGVSHDDYAHQLAVDMNASPSFLDAVRIGSSRKEWWRLPLVWLLAAEFNTKFRLRGPWKWDGAVDVMSGELWYIVKRRGGFFKQIMLSGVPLAVFGSLHLLLWIFMSLFKPSRR